MDKYRRVEKKEQTPESPENQIRVTVGGRIRAYITYAKSILVDETKSGGVELLGLGNAIGKAVTVSELLRRITPDLEQVTTLGSIEIKDRYEPLEEGLDAIETVRNVSSIHIHLAVGGLDKTALGYQPPLRMSKEEELAEVHALIDSLDNSDKRVSGSSRSNRRRPGLRRGTGRPRRGGRGRDENGQREGDEGRGESSGGGGMSGAVDVNEDEVGDLL